MRLSGPRTGDELDEAGRPKHRMPIVKVGRSRKFTIVVLTEESRNEGKKRDLTVQDALKFNFVAVSSKPFRLLKLSETTSIWFSSPTPLSETYQNSEERCRATAIALL